MDSFPGGLIDESLFLLLRDMSVSVGSDSGRSGGSSDGAESGMGSAGMLRNCGQFRYGVLVSDSGFHRFGPVAFYGLRPVRGIGCAICDQRIFFTCSFLPCTLIISASSSASLQ